jgi:hypothetical protein
MSARYWVLVADELMSSDLQWPEGLRPVKADEGVPPDSHSRWWLFEDDGAPATLEGKRVELFFTRSGSGVMIGGRRPAT